MDTVDVLWNVSQQRQIKDIRRTVGQASIDASHARDRTVDLEQSLEKLALTCRAMWELVSESLSISEGDLVARVREIDLRDGHLDGRLRSEPQSCPDCKRVNGGARTRCLYCGTELRGPQAFEPG